MRESVTSRTFWFAVCDVIVTNGAFGLFTNNWNFDREAALKTVTFSDDYSFTRSPRELHVLGLLRQTLWMIAIFGNTEHSKHFVVPNALLTFGVCLVKLLAFSEHIEQLRLPGAWISVVWSVVSSLLLVFVPEYPCPDVGKKDDPSLPKMSNRDLAAAMYKYVAPYWFQFLVGLVFLLISASASTLIPTYISNLARGTSTDGTDGCSDKLILVGLLLTLTFFEGVSVAWFDNINGQLVHCIRNDMFAALLRQEIGFFDTTRPGILAYRLREDCNTISRMASRLIVSCLHKSLMLIGYFVVMFSISWRLTLIHLIWVPLVFYINERIWDAWNIAFAKFLKATEEVTSSAREVLSTMRTVRSFANEKNVVSRFNELLEAALLHRQPLTFYRFSYTALMEGVDSVFLIVSFFYGMHLVMEDRMEATRIVAFFFYFSRLRRCFSDLSLTTDSFFRIMSACRKVFGVIDRKPQFEMNGTRKPTVEGNLKLTNVTFTYPSRSLEVLKNLDLEIKTGETVAFVGPSGSGKSSIVGLFERFYEPDEGIVTLDGVPIGEFDHEYYHQQVSIVDQMPTLFTGTIRSNILYGYESGTEEEMIEAAKIANVHDFVTSLDEGYETECGEGGVQLSGGQKQRIAIARALVRNPKVLILDEATSALDGESEALVHCALRRCAKERTVVIIAHRMATIRHADRIFVIEKGTVVQLGTHSQLMRDTDGLYHSLVTGSLMSLST